MTAEIVYEGELRTQAIHIKSGNKIITDAPSDNHGKGEAFSPTDLVSTALGSCMLTIMGILADRNDWDIRGTKITVQKMMASNPRRIDQVEINLTVPATNLDDKAKAMLERAARNCPVALSLHPDLIQRVAFNYT